MSGIRMRCRYCRLLLSAIAAVTPLLVNATSTMTVKVTVIAPPPCTINGDKPIEVEFGEVMTTRVDGTNYRMPVDYTLECTQGEGKGLKLQVQGNGAGFDGQVLKTNIAALGIELQRENVRLAVNDWLNFTYPNKPALYAVPVMQSGATLPGGEFTAGATMKIAYQ